MSSVYTSDMYIAMLGRQPVIGMAELERVFEKTRWFSHDTALIQTTTFDIQRLGGTVKAGHVILELSGTDWRQTSMEIVRHYSRHMSSATGKMTLGISVYGFKVSPRDVQHTGLILKSHLKQSGISLRLIPNEQAALSTATAHHNKLGLSPNKIELLVIKGHGGNVIVAESTGAQNITALARRDQGRPARDAFVGMLPPKLAQIMINLAATTVEASQVPFLKGDVTLRASQAPQTDHRSPVERPPKENGTWLANHGTARILDPFCGTGVVLQEAALMGHNVIGTDLSDKMIDYSIKNMDWLKDRFHIATTWDISQGDAMTATWQQPIDAVVCEAYLGQPFSAPPRPEKLEQVRGNCNHIITEFLKNIGPQIKPGTPLCVAVPAWNDGTDSFTHLPLIKKLDQLGYRSVEFTNVNAKDLLYYRPGQVVARELLVLEKI